MREQGMLSSLRGNEGEVLSSVELIDYFDQMVPFTQLAYPSNLTLRNNHVLTEFRTHRFNPLHIHMIFHSGLIQKAVSCTSTMRIPGRWYDRLLSINRGFCNIQYIGGHGEHCINSGLCHISLFKSTGCTAVIWDFPSKTKNSSTNDVHITVIHSVPGLL